MFDRDRWRAAQEFHRMRWYEGVLCLLGQLVFLFAFWVWLDYPENWRQLGLAVLGFFVSGVIRAVIIHDVYERILDEEADK
jgi:hypothetical protein